MSYKATIFTDNSDLDYILNYIDSCEYLAFDTETTGLNVRKDMVIGMSICGNYEESIYIVHKTWDSANEGLNDCISEDVFVKILNALKNKDLLMWNGSFDIQMIRNNFKVDLVDSLQADVMLMKHTVQEDGDFRLKQTMIEYSEELGIDGESIANKEQIELKENVIKNGGSTTKNNYEMFKADLEVMGPYAAADAYYTFALGNIFHDRILEEGLDEFFFDKEVMPLYKTVTIPMESKGVKLNLDLIRKIKEEISHDIQVMHNRVQKELMDTPEAQAWFKYMLAEKYPVNNKGNFSQGVCKYFNLDLPISEKTGKYSVSAKNIENLPESLGKSFLQDESTELSDEIILDIQKLLYFAKESNALNLSSKKQMGEIVFDFMKIKPLSKTDKGTPQFNETMIQHISDEYKFKWARDLSNLNKLYKIEGSYIDRFLNGHEEGYIYFYYKQHGTISGRFSSDAQQLPRPKEEGELDDIVLKYNNVIREFFIADEDRMFADLDYESLEPHVFAHVSGDDKLRDIFRKGHDFYSTIAIQTEKLENVSADKSADNYLGKVNKPVRQKAKAYSLGVPYGLTPYALAMSLEVSKEEAKVLYDGYLDGFPDLKVWMDKSKLAAQYKGFVSTETGRMRHLNKVQKLHQRHGDKLLNWKYRKKIEKTYGKEEVLSMYRDYKNGINNARNFQIQGLSASIVNLSMIKINKYFKDNNIDAWVCSTIHDQIIVNCPKKLAEDLAKVIEDIMCNIIDLSVTLKAPPATAKNWKDSH